MFVRSYICSVTEITPITLTELSHHIQGAINRYFGAETYWVIAEISSHKFYPNNDRHYFDFIEKAEGSNEPQARIRGISWFQGSQSIKLFEQETGQTFGNGMQVLCRVKVEYHPAHGLSLIVQEIDVTYTLGNLEKQRRETLERLVRDNPEFIQKIGDEYITTNKKAELPQVIQNIAVIGSPNSEGYVDFVHTIENNKFGYTFQLYNYQTSVQGIGAETEIITTLIEIHQSERKYDCVVIIRGGGAKTDFLVFDTYRLSRAVAKFPVPIITGIGHHKDVSIVDMMVHTTTKTPTKAAEFIVSNNHTFEESIIHLQKQIVIKTQQLISYNKSEIHAYQTELGSLTRSLLTQHKEELNYFRHLAVTQSKSIIYNYKNNLMTSFGRMLTQPVIHLHARATELDTVLATIKNHTTHFLVLKKGYVGHYHSMIQMMHPSNILKKGFAIIKQNDAIISNAVNADKDLPLTVMMHDAKIETTIKTITHNHGQETDL